MYTNELDYLLNKAYTACSDSGIIPESREKLAAFQQQHKMIFPEEYRQLLEHFGSLRFMEPEIYGLNELEWAYPRGMDLIAEYRKQQALPPKIELLPIGSFGDGDLLVLQPGGVVYRLYHDGYDDSPLEWIAKDLPSLLTMLCEWALEAQQKIMES
ncbi:SMI1/KNR4 family protein [Paenibacillus shenyangensis]|uniref:SMI1/KNR4 family protein n=1 Tax=Paenibacillus sp. A9 TaxID=1284352 RepID=UPI00036FE47C|nr:SMI1/KNR4 family protein [Paenibacillus sp. A9]